MNLLTQKVVEFWDNIKDTFPEGTKLEAADQLAGHFMGESAEIEFGLGYDPDAEEIDLDDEFPPGNAEEDFESSNDFQEVEEDD